MQRRALVNLILFYPRVGGWLIAWTWSCRRRRPVLICRLSLSHILPNYFILENVKGFYTVQKGSVYKEVMAQLEALNHYHISVQTLNTKDYGVPQSRHRMYIWPTSVEHVFVGIDELGLARARRVLHLPAEVLV